MKRKAAAVLYVASVLAVAPSAASATSGVTVDPNSPAGKEYAIPLDQARREATGGKGSAPSASGGAASGQSGQGGAALFGEGITPLAATGKGVEPSSGPRRGPGRKGGSPSTSAGAKVGTATQPVSATAMTTSIVLAVVVVGAGLGTVIRLRTRNR